MTLGLTGAFIGFIALFVAMIHFAMSQGPDPLTSSDETLYDAGLMVGGAVIVLGLIAIAYGVAGLGRKEFWRTSGIALATGSLAVALLFGVVAGAVMVAIIMLSGLIAWCYLEG